MVCQQMLVVATFSVPCGTRIVAPAVALRTLGVRRRRGNRYVALPRVCDCIMA